jgi:hypothetical protein
LKECTATAISMPASGVLCVAFVLSDVLRGVCCGWRLARRRRCKGEGNARTAATQANKQTRAYTHARAACVVSNAIGNRNDPKRTAHDALRMPASAEKKKKQPTTAVARGTRKQKTTAAKQTTDASASHTCVRHPPLLFLSSLSCVCWCGAHPFLFSAAAAVLWLLWLALLWAVSVASPPAQHSGPSPQQQQQQQRGHQRERHTGREEHTKWKVTDGYAPRSWGGGSLLCSAFERKSRCALAGWGRMLGAGAGARCTDMAASVWSAMELMSFAAVCIFSCQSAMASPFPQPQPQAQLLPAATAASAASGSGASEERFGSQIPFAEPYCT